VKLTSRVSSDDGSDGMDVDDGTAPTASKSTGDDLAQYNLDEYDNEEHDPSVSQLLILVSPILTF
jgi:hypothetical protein